MDRALAFVQRILKPYSSCILLCVAMLLAAEPTFASNLGWIGTWRLDRTRSRFVGPSITIGRIPNGYHFDFGAVSFNVGDDGKDYPTIPTRTTSLKAIDSRHWFRVHKVAGKEVDQSAISVDADGRTMRIRTHAFSPNGGARFSDETLERQGAGVGLAGKWRSTAAGLGVPTVFTIEVVDRGQLRWNYPTERQYYTATPNGTRVALQGAGSVPGLTVAMLIASRVHARWTQYVNGKPYTIGIDTLSADGTSLQETTWQAGRPADRQRAVYERAER